LSSACVRLENDYLSPGKRRKVTSVTIRAVVFTGFMRTVTWLDRNLSRRKLLYFANPWFPFTIQQAPASYTES
jgi:hypothetical protein